MNGCGLVRRVLVKATKRVGKTFFRFPFMWLQECVKTTIMLYANLPYFLSARTLVRPSRLQKLLPLWGARDVMSACGLEQPG